MTRYFTTYLAILQQLHACCAWRPTACFTPYWRNFVCDVHTEATRKKYKNYVLFCHQCWEATVKVRFSLEQAMRNQRGE